MNGKAALFLALALGTASLIAADSKSPAPAKVENAVKETELATLKLTPQAEQRLGIVLVDATRKQVAVTRLFGGDVMVPLAASNAAPGAYFPLASATPDELLKLSDQQAVADGDIEKVRVQLEAAQRALARAKKLIAEDAGSVRVVEEATAASQLAQASLEVAKARRSLLGAPVAEAVRGQRLWVRVPVYAGELKLIDTAKEARIGTLGSRPGETNFPARPVAAPPSASPVAATVDLFYEIEGAQSALKPGHRVSVSLIMRGESESLVVPWAAIIHDIHGNTWVYECVAPQTFTRQRVQVARIVGNDAVLASGPRPGARVVTDGAAELFGTEFGTK